MGGLEVNQTKPYAFLRRFAATIAAIVLACLPTKEAKKRASVELTAKTLLNEDGVEAGMDVHR